MKHIDNIAKWILILLFALIVGLAVFSCNPVKQVLKSQDKTEEVVAEYVKKNPQKNDTVFTPGETVYRDTVFFDSIPLPYPVNHKYTEIRVAERFVRDTITVIDRSFTEALSNRLKNLEVQIGDLRAEVSEWKSKAQIRLYWLIGLITAIIGAGVFWVIKTFQPKITIGK